MPAGELSHGDQKKVDIARALCVEPSLLLLDEPVAGMNAHETHEVGELIRDIRAAFEIPVLLVEHDMGLVMEIADRVTVLDFGRVIADGTPAEVQTRPRGDPGLPREPATDRARAIGSALMEKLLQLLFSGVALGAVYALLALGFVVVFKATQVVNFAHAGLLMVGTYCVARFRTVDG